VWTLSWFLLIIAIVAGALGVGVWLTGVIRALPVFLVSIISWLGVAIIETYGLSYLGDAARYFDDHPANYKIRTDIREKGVELLGKLIRSRTYDRIVVVGHSLGSVIAYDALKHLWETEFWKAYPNYVPDLLQPALAEYEAAAENLKAESDDETIVRYQEKQNELLRELRAFGNPWSVTDLVTLGAPLAHASDLMLNFKGDRSLGVLPENPPQFYRGGKWVALQADDLIKGAAHPRIPPSRAVCRHAMDQLVFPYTIGPFRGLYRGPLASVVRQRDPRSRSKGAGPASELDVVGTFVVLARCCVFARDRD
jgi:hypothetical protein